MKERAIRHLYRKHFSLIKKIDIFYERIKTIWLLTIIAYLRQIRRAKVTNQLATLNYIIRF